MVHLLVTVVIQTTRVSAMATEANMDVDVVLIVQRLRIPALVVQEILIDVVQGAPELEQLVKAPFNDSFDRAVVDPFNVVIQLNVANCTRSIRMPLT